MSSLPFEINEAIIQCFGKCFHYKDTVASFMITSQVPKYLVDKYRDKPKFVWARNVLSDLNQIEEGYLIQKRLLTELCKFRNVVDQDVPDKHAGIDALRSLKNLALEHKLIVKKQQETDKNNRLQAEERLKIVENRTEKLKSIREQFHQRLSAKDRQEAGYVLENILKELFSIFEIEYDPPYRTDTQQIDGHFVFDGFNYLVEARWRQDIPNEQEIGGFERKVKTKLQSTRGLFVSVQGFRQEVIEKFNGEGAQLIFMNGEDLTYILEGRFDLKDVLRWKIDYAARKGIVFLPLKVDSDVPRAKTYGK